MLTMCKEIWLIGLMIAVDGWGRGQEGVWPVSRARWDQWGVVVTSGMSSFHLR